MKKALVIRNVGGFGDLMMMSPAIARLIGDGYHVTLVLDKRWHPLFEHWDDGSFTLTEHAEEADKFDLVADLNHPCPASYLECRWTEATRIHSTGRCFVPVNRCETFWTSCGLSPQDAAEMPSVMLSDEDMEVGQAFVYEALNRSCKPEGTQVVYVQGKTAAAYRDWPRIAELATVLARRGYAVITSDITPTPEIVPLAPMSILQACAVMRECCLVVSPDSMAVHAAAAVGTPCVMVAGPIDPAARMERYTWCSSVTADMPCVSCWRNDDIKCKAGDCERSLCLDKLPLEPVLDAVLARLRAMSGPCGKLYAGFTKHTRVKVKAQE